MHLRFSRLVAVAAMLAVSLGLALPAFAQPTAAETAETIAKIRALKQNYVMKGARAKILRARAMAYLKKHGKMPQGYKLEPSRRPPRVEPGDPGSVAPVAAESNPTVITAFPANKRINSPAGDAAGTGQSETSVAAYGDNIVVTWNDGQGFNTFFAPSWQLMGFGYSTDGGATWTDGGAIPIPSITYPNWCWLSDPVVTVNETNGEFWFCGLVGSNGFPQPDGPGTRNGIGVVKGTFSGSNFTWGTPVLAFDALNTTASYDKQWLAVNPANGYLYLCYTTFNSTGDQIDFRRSIDNGATWSAAAKLSANVDNGYVQGSRVVVGPNGEVYVCWQALGPTDADYFKVRKSTNNGTSFGGEVIAATYFSNFSSGAPGFNRERGITYPGMAVDRTNGPNRGRVHLAWNESVNFYTEVYFGTTSGSVVEPEGVSANGVNDTPGTAISFVPGNKLRGWLGNASDNDYFKFTATQGTTYIFYVDSLNATIDMAFRVICSDGATRLAISSPGTGFSPLIVWTAPSSGTYYLRPAPWSGTGYYSIKTFVDLDDGEPGRDQRDVFVNYSNDGVTSWSTQVLANDDPPYYDNWLPEIAVTGHSRVFTAWFDWRDSAPSKCGGESNIYLSRSDNGGTSWTPLGRVSDATSSWTTVASNVAPNQGDYIALFANYNGVYPAWGDGRDGDANVYAVNIPIATPTLAALVNSAVEAGRVELTWAAADWVGQVATLERREDADGWASVGSQVVDGGGRVSFVDAAVAAGREYTYRLAFGNDGTPSYSSESVVRVPAGAAFALEGARPNPASSDLTVSFSLPRSAPATLSLVDIGGRAVVSREVGGLGAGSHRIALGEGRTLNPGVYIVVLRQGERVQTQRVSVVR